MAFWCRLGQSKLRQLVHHIPCASLLSPTVSKACVADNPLISHGLPTDFGSKLGSLLLRFRQIPIQMKRRQSMARMAEHLSSQRVKLWKRARDLELDLVEVQAQLILLFSKNVKTLRADSKEVKFSPKTEAKDLKMKADMVKRFMDKGYRVKCTASDSEGRNLGAVFFVSLLIEDAAYIECEPTPGRGKESFIMVRHVKFGPPKGGGKKTKAEDNKIPEKGGDDGIGVTTRSDTVPVPPQESSGEAENRYRKIEARNQISPTREMDSKGETTNKGEPHMPYQRRETPTNSHFSPSIRDPRIPYQRREAPTNSHFSSPMRESNRAETTPSAFRNSLRSSS
ncbi:hypothetical protein M0R45_009773 [Rubus argutus]|uniref:Translation initiation factor 3 N-terminal domain-containing protein n=1 Tax=Rubus argutus TaxID=59490 RepID=A0AAW1Y551_RUBAR